MLEPDLVSSSIHYHDMVKRNIVAQSSYEEAFASLLDENDKVEIAITAHKRARNSIAGSNKSNDFYYTAAIEYPFQTKPYMQTRYSDGTFPVWYGSKTIETTLRETIYHTIKFVKATEGWSTEKRIVKHRSLYDVFCDAILINLLGKEKLYPKIISHDYAATNKIGSYIKNRGVPGILSPSARHPSGENINIFNQNVLKNPNFLFNLRYVILPQEEKIKVLGLKSLVEFAL